MSSGVCKWFNVKKGYGFIEETETGLDIFVHQTALDRAGIPELKPGQPLEFTHRENDRGFIVADILSVGEAPRRSNDWCWADATPIAPAFPCPRRPGAA